MEIYMKEYVLKYQIYSYDPTISYKTQCFITFLRNIYISIQLFLVLV